MEYVINQMIIFSPAERALFIINERESFMPLSNPATRLLLELVTHHKEMLTRRHLMQRVWEDNGFVGSNNNLNGCISEIRKAFESLALDPNNSGRLYMLVGIEYFNNGRTAILRSNDYGNTFTITEVTNQFKAHGNGMGRQTGEKLVVDPNNSNILYCGTRWNGLFKSTDAGATWQERRIGGPFDLRRAPYADGYFLGDYVGMVAAGTTFHAIVPMVPEDGEAPITDIYSVTIRFPPSSCSACSSAPGGGCGPTPQPAASPSDGERSLAVHRDVTK